MYSTTRANRVVAKLVLTLGLACLMVAASIASLLAVPPLPHTLYGSVTLGGASAPDLTRIAVLADGATTITTTATSGVYTVNVPGNDGDTITFAIYGYEIAETRHGQKLRPFENCVVNTVPLSASKQLARLGRKRTTPTSGQHAGMVLSRERERRGSSQRAEYRPALDTLRAGFSFLSW